MPTPASRPPLRAVPRPAASHPDDDAPRASALQFAEAVRLVVGMAQRRALRPPVFRSPPGLAGVDRSIRRRPNGTVVVAVRRTDRPLAAVQADVIEGVVAANGLVGEAADRFRHSAWERLAGASPAPAPPRATMERPPPARVA